MNIKGLKELIKDIPDDISVKLFNASSEWYGIEDIYSDNFKVIGNSFVLNFGGVWEKYSEDAYNTMGG